jgi:catechol 2,3-dioxygenase-like lactoylglutathione lyase family enzyme
MIRVTGIDHVQLAIPAGGEEEARRFYGGLLGLAEVPKPPAYAARGGCWFAAPGFQLHLGVEAPFAPARKAHPALRVTDVEAVRRALVAAGVPVVPDDSVPGVRHFYAQDPFGNRLELMQEGDGFAQGAWG